MLWSPNTQLHYPFENQANDYSGNARHGTVNGSGVYATRPNGGRCLYFDGVGDYVATPSFGLSGTVVWFSADVRCKLYAANLQQFLYGLPTYWVYRRINSFDFAVHYGVDYYASPNFFQSYEDAWVHVITVSDYTHRKTYFYRNALLVTSTSLPAAALFPSAAAVYYVGGVSGLLTYGYLANVKFGTLATMPPVAGMNANANRLMLGLHPIW